MGAGRAVETGADGDYSISLPPGTYTVRFFRKGFIEQSIEQVVVLPGYARGERYSEQGRAVEAGIQEVARKWKLQVNPRDDLAYYPELYHGSSD